MADEQEQCVFCNIIAGKIPASKLYEDDKVIAVLDINPGASGHLLLIPKKHTSIMPQLDEDISSHMGMVAKQLSRALIRALNIEGTSIFVANGALAGQRAPHVLMHIIPRAKGDNIDLDLPAIKLDEKTFEAVFAKLVPGVKKHFNFDIKLPEKTEVKAPVKKSEDKPKESEAKPESKKSENKPDSKKPAAKKSLDEISEFLLK